MTEPGINIAKPGLICLIERVIQMSKSKASRKNNMKWFIVFIVFSLMVFVIFSERISPAFTALGNGLISIGAIILGMLLVYNILDYLFKRAKSNL
jgi:hypothetical protein